MEQSREEFEKWFRGWIDENMNDSCWPSVSLKELAEMSWQASRAAVVVKLPSECGRFADKYYADGWDSCRGECVKAIKAQGLTVK